MADPYLRRASASLAVVVLAAWRVLGAVPDAESERLPPDQLVFLLEYIGADYGAAVRDGKVVDALEHQEMVEFSRIVAEQYPRVGHSDPTMAGLTTLRKLIRDLRPWAEVRAHGLALASRMAEELGVAPRLDAAPDPVHGRGLYEQACAACHGTSGGGDGPAAAGMKPPPSSFREPRMNLLRPSQVHAATRYGVEGTPMPSFAGGFTSQQIWDIAFYVMTLRQGFDPRPPGAPIPVSLDDLAGSSNQELLARLRALRPETAASDLDFYRLQPPPPSAAGQASGPGAAEPPDLGAALLLEHAFGRVAERVFPSVVGLSFYVRDPAGPSAHGTGWREGGAADSSYPGYRLARTGSGFFASDDGYILSCHHLVVDPRTGELPEIVDVELDGNRHVRGRVIGVEPTVNLAVLKAEVPIRTPAALPGDPEGVRVGQWAIAMGDPPGVDRTFVPGTISSRPERDCYQEERTSTLLQTSLRIPKESFGGPLVNIRAEVVGITMPRTQTPLATETEPGAVFALPIHLAMTLYEAIKVKESRLSPWLGISVLELTSKLRRTLRSTPLTGVYIDDVFDPSPASRAGIRVGDILSAIDGNRLFAVPDFQKWLYLMGTGKTVSLEIYRDGEILRNQVTIEERPSSAIPR